MEGFPDHYLASPQRSPGCYDGRFIGAVLDGNYRIDVWYPADLHQTEVAF